MRIENTETAKVFTIFDAPKLDPITVVLQDLGDSCGRLIIECWGSAWSAYWGGMGNRTLAEFITDSHPEYIATKLAPTTGRRPTKSDEAYLMRITEAVHSAMRSNQLLDRPFYPAKKNVSQSEGHSFTNFLNNITAIKGLSIKKLVDLTLQFNYFFW